MVICPKCGSNHVAEIIYGMPSKQSYDAYKNNEVIMGGCCIGQDDPDYGCLDCDFKWSTKMLTEENYINKIHITVIKNNSYNPDKVKTSIYNIDREGNVDKNDYEGLSRKPENTQQFIINVDEVTDAVKKLLDYIKCDGKGYVQARAVDDTNYRVQLTYKDNRIYTFTGDVTEEDYIWSIASKLIS